MSECTRCGLCCTQVTVHVKDEDHRKFFELHNWRIEDDPVTGFSATIPSVCDWLEFKDGIATCAHYDERPGTCQRHECAS